MTIFRHEMRSSLKSVFIWGVSISALVVILMLLFPRVERQAEFVTKMLSGLNLLTMAFGLDKLDYATPMGFYGVEAGNIISLGGGLFAGITGISLLAKEEGRRTSEFLFSHPLSRFWAITQKLMSLVLQLVLLCTIFIASSFLAFALVGRTVETPGFFMLHLAQFLAMLQTGLICFGLSAFLRRENPGIGIVLPLVFFFLNVLINISRGDVDFFRYVTPVYYAESGRILNGAIDWHFVMVGYLTAAVFLLAGYTRYLRKDLAV